MVLLLAMSLAMAVGMLAWGPIMLTPADHVFADKRSWAGIPSVFNTLACLPLVVVSLWGMRAVWRRRDWPSELRGPWFAFFGLCMLMSAAAGAHHLDPTDLGYALVHSFAAAAFIMLGQAFMAERMDRLFGTGPSMIAGMTVAGCAAGWWAIGQWAFGHGDLRAFLFFECLPLLLIPAGALSLRGDQTTATDWLSTLGLYLLARGTGLCDGLIQGWTGGLSGHTLMHLLLAASAACLAYRASASPGPSGARTVSLVDPVHRNASLNTSS